LNAHLGEPRFAGLLLSGQAEIGPWWAAKPQQCCTKSCSRFLTKARPRDRRLDCCASSS